MDYRRLLGPATYLAIGAAFAFAASGLIKGCSGDEHKSGTIVPPDSLAITEGLEHYQKRIRELEGGLAWYKRIFEKEVVPLRAKLPRDTSRARLAGDEALLQATMTPKGLEVLTERGDAYMVYRYGRLGKRWELLADPEGGGYRLIEKRTFVEYDGTAIGLGYMARAEGGTHWQLSAETGLTFFDRVVLKAEVAYPIEVRGRFMWKF